jgi:hypothetical protein
MALEFSPPILTTVSFFASYTGQPPISLGAVRGLRANPAQTALSRALSLRSSSVSGLRERNSLVPKTSPISLPCHAPGTPMSWFGNSPL